VTPQEEPDLAKCHLEYSGVILAGGQSSRLGVDKAAVLIGGRTLLERALSALRPFCDDLLVVGRTSWPEVLPGVRFAADEKPGLGPLGGLCTALGLIRHARALVVGCDMPLLTEDTMRELLGQDGAEQATVARTHGRPQPLLAVYDRDLRPLLRRQLDSQDRSLMSLLRAVSVRYVDLSAPQACLSVNSPEQLEEARRLARERGEP